MELIYNFLYLIRDKLVSVPYVIYAMIILFLMFALIGYLFKQKYGKLDVKLASSQEVEIKKNEDIIKNNSETTNSELVKDSVENNSQTNVELNKNNNNLNENKETKANQVKEQVTEEKNNINNNLNQVKSKEVNETIPIPVKIENSDKTESIPEI